MTYLLTIDMKKNEKKFDSVKMMREIRDSLSKQFKRMNFEEQKQYMRQQTQVTPVKASSEKSRTQHT